MSARTLAMAILSAAVLAASGQAHGFSLGSARSITGTATSDAPTAGDGAASVAFDGAGSWVTVWTSQDSALGAVGPGWDILYARSTDNGSTWTTPQVLNDSVATDEGLYPTIVSDGGGTVLATWLSSSTIEVSRSTDGGLTWSLDQGLGATVLQASHATGDGAGHWIIVWSSEHFGGDSDVLFSRSLDNGETWSPPAAVDSSATSDAWSDGEPRIATDRLGRWVTVWESGLGQIVAATSTDNGATWSTPVAVGPAYAAITARPDIMTRGDGRWLAVWTAHLAEPSHSDGFSAYSDDQGATWSTPVHLSNAFATNGSALEEHPRLAYTQQGTWIAVWDSWNGYGGALGTSRDLLMSASVDNGVSWSGPSSILPDARDDEAGNRQPTLATDGAGSWLMVWERGGGSLGNDGDIFFATGHDDCPAVPRTGCKTTGSGDARLVLSDGGNFSDKLTWKWSGGQETTPSEIADPTVSSDYVVCLYDSASGTPRLLVEEDAKAASDCGSQPCWAATSGGYQYFDTTYVQGGIRRLKLQAGAEGRSGVQVTLQGPSFGPPPMPVTLGPSVRMQVANLETDVCWEAVYTTARTNTAKIFSARND